MKCTFRGSYVALPTPMAGEGLDLEALRGLVDFHLARGSDGLVVAGTSGEAATLTDQERARVLETVLERACGRLPVLAGVGTNATRTTLEHARAAQAAGADGLLVVTPYYNRPSPEGLFRHFAAVAGSTRLPIVLYNVPSRTGCDLKPPTVARLRSAFPHIVAIKEASGTLARIHELAASCDIALIAGEDGLIAQFMAAGGAGVIGVVANVAPREVAELCRAAAPGGDSARAADLVRWLAPLVRDLFIETNPVPLKAALASMGLCRDEVRLPLAPLLPGSRDSLLATLREKGLVAGSSAPAARATASGRAGRTGA